MKIKTHVILGGSLDGPLGTKLKEQYGTSQKEVCIALYKAIVGTKEVFCCWAGGTINRETNEPMLTLVGAASVESLAALPGEPYDLVIQEVRKGKRPIQDKIIESILAAPEGARICFVGDLAGELDGEMSKAFNLCGEPIILPGSSFAEETE